MSFINFILLSSTMIWLTNNSLAYSKEEPSTPKSMLLFGVTPRITEPVSPETKEYSVTALKHYSGQLYLGLQYSGTRSKFFPGSGFGSSRTEYDEEGNVISTDSSFYEAKYDITIQRFSLIGQHLAKNGFFATGGIGVSYYYGDYILKGSSAYNLKSTEIIDPRANFRSITIFSKASMGFQWQTGNFLYGIEWLSLASPLWSKHRTSNTESIDEARTYFSGDLESDAEYANSLFDLKIFRFFFGFQL